MGQYMIKHSLLVKQQYLINMVWLEQILLFVDLCIESIVIRCSEISVECYAISLVTSEEIKKTRYYSCTL